MKFAKSLTLIQWKFQRIVDIILALVNLIRSGNPIFIYYSSNHLL